MKKTILFALLSCSLMAYSQSPAQFNFQGIARNGRGKVIVAKTIALRFSIRMDNPSGYVSYQEQRSALTDSNGVFNAIIGGAGATSTTGALDTVFWTTGPRFLQVEMDTANGSAFVDLGATQLLSVPYALYSNNSLNSGYAASSGSYFFNVFFPNRDTIPNPGTLVFPRANYNQMVRELITDAGGVSYYIIRPVYDSTTGEFRAPVDGMYEFDVSLSEIPHPDSDGSLDEIFFIKNGVRIRMLTQTWYEFSPTNYGQFFTCIVRSF